jgi:hypothetical protein
MGLWCEFEMCLVWTVVIRTGCTSVLNLSIEMALKERDFLNQTCT